MSVVDNVIHVSHGKRELHLIGTAHVSQKSVEEVKRVIRELRPDTVCVELDASRLSTLTDPTRFRRLEPAKIIRDGQVNFFLVSLLLTAFQRRIGQKLGVTPGAELLAAVETAREVGAELVLADRDIQATLRRSWANLSLWNRVELRLALVLSLFRREEISSSQVEALKERDTMGEAMKEFAEIMPGLKVPLIDERDRYLMSQLQEAPGTQIVGVVGAAHLDGMLQHLGSSIDREELAKLPEEHPLAALRPWILPAVVLGLVAWAVVQRSPAEAAVLLRSFLLAYLSLVALFTLLSGARLLTLAATCALAPLSALYPPLGPGLVAGLVEARLRRPSVADCDGLPDALLSLRSMYRNRFSRVLLVSLGARLGGLLGTLVGLAWLLLMLL
jgi:pheromone shutdown-related protein TraB